MKEHGSSHKLFESKNPFTFNISIKRLPIHQTIRNCKTSEIGKLMSIHGTVTRTSQVRPELIAGTFRCLDCRTLNSLIKQQFKYTEVI
jgi:DNA replication licensing factor MCM6